MNQPASSLAFKKAPSEAGFSLVEILMVLGIISILSALAIPAFTAIAASHGITQGAYDVSTLLEYGRTEAVTKQTYTWVVFQNTTVAGQPEVKMAAFSSLDGSATLNATNIRSLTRILHVTGANVIPWSSLKTTTQGLLSSVLNETATPTDASTYSQTTPYAFLPGPANYSVTFTPRGEAMLPNAPTANTSYDPWIDVGIAQATGSGSKRDDAAVVIDGSTGSVQRIRL
jgi:prepilin-type N-terminal cleavage/methylation domain-containing protein